MTVRRLEEKDLPALRDLWLRGLQDTPDAFTTSYEEEAHQPLAYFRRYLEQGPLLGYESDGALQGIIAVWQPDRRLQSRHKSYIGMLYVAPEARRKGIARALLEAAIGAAGAFSEQVYLGVSFGNGSALRLYESLGFVTYAHEPRSLKIGERYIDELLMVKRLPHAPK